MSLVFWDGKEQPGNLAPQKFAVSGRHAHGIITKREILGVLLAGGPIPPLSLPSEVNLYGRNIPVFLALAPVV